MYFPVDGGSADRSVGCLAGRHLVDVDSSAAPGSWVFRFGADCRLDVGGTWRLIDGGRITISGGDHQQMFGLAEPVDARRRALDGIGAAVVEQAAFGDVTGDLTIEFEEHLRLQVLTDSAGYESWALWRPDGTQVVAEGGGRVLLYARAPGH